MSDPTDYKYLIVELVIDRKKSDLFEKQMRILLPKLFENRTRNGMKWKLLSAAKAEPAGNGIKYQHLWQLPSEASLTDAMVILGRDSDYAVLDQCKISETQDFFTVAATYSPPEGPDALFSSPDGALAVETVDAPSNWFTLHSWMSAMPIVASAVRKQMGLTLVFALQPETGRLRRFLNFWRPANQALEQDHAQRALESQPIRVFDPGVATAGNPKGKARDQGQPKPITKPYKELAPSTFQIYRRVDYRRVV